MKRIWNQLNGALCWSHYLYRLGLVAQEWVPYPVGCRLISIFLHLLLPFRVVTFIHFPYWSLSCAIFLSFLNCIHVSCSLSYILFLFLSQLSLSSFFRPSFRYVFCFSLIKKNKNKFFELQLQRKPLQSTRTLRLIGRWHYYRIILLVDFLNQVATQLSS